MKSNGNQVFGFRPGALESARTQISSGSEILHSTLRRLLAEADDALGRPPVSVMDKPGAAASGDRHDFLSLAPYFWPDPSKENGLPYSKRDCEVNPEIHSNRSDKESLKSLSRNTENLALAYALTGNESYAETAARQLRVWFLDRETRMNPHLEYAQTVQGLPQGRSYGVLEGHYLLYALDAAGMLIKSPHWGSEDQNGLVEWMKAYRQWLLKSENGKKESSRNNNHGTLYDVQIVHISLFVGDRELAAQTAKKARKKRIAAQIERDGSQPSELKRAEALWYSQYNLWALFRLATRAEHLGIDLWNYQTFQGAGIRKAIDFLIPYLDEPAKPWPYSGSQPEPRFGSVLLQAARVYNEERYLRLHFANPDSACIQELIR